jgi:hypothetical protein
MKYKILIVSLLSTLAAPYGTTAAMDRLFEPFTNSRLIAKANDTQDKAAITLSRIDHQVGGSGNVDVAQRLQNSTNTLDNRASSLDNAVNNLFSILAEVSGDDLKTKIANLIQASEKEKMITRELREKLNGLESESQPSSNPTTQPYPLPTPSSHQQGLLSRKDQIGKEAWNLLGGENASLAAALSNSIQQNSGTVEILSLESNSFTLRVNGKEQYHPYKF